MSKELIQEYYKWKDSSSYITVPLDTRNALAKIISNLEWFEHNKEHIGKGHPLPSRRKGFTQKVRIQGHKIFLRTGEYEDGSLGEIFIDNPKLGSALRGFLHCFAICFSIGLRYGVPLQVFVKAFKDFDFEPNGLIEGSNNVKECKSIIDYIMNEIELSYLKDKVDEQTGF